MDTSRRQWTNKELEEAARYIEAWLLMEVPGSLSDKFFSIAVDCIEMAIAKGGIDETD